MIGRLSRNGFLFCILNLSSGVSPAKALTETDLLSAFDSLRLINCAQMIESSVTSGRIGREVAENLEPDEIQPVILFEVRNALLPETFHHLISPSYGVGVRARMRGSDYDDAIDVLTHSYLDRALQFTGQFDAGLIDGGEYRPAVLIGLHSFGANQARALEYLAERGMIGTMPFVQVRGRDSFRGSNNATLKASVIRISGGEVKDIVLNTPLVYFFGGALGGCLTVGIHSVANMILDQGDRREANIVVITEISYISSEEPLHLEILRNCNSMDTSPLCRYKAHLSDLLSDYYGPEFLLVDSREDQQQGVGSSRVDLQACKLEYSIVSPK